MTNSPDYRKYLEEHFKSINESLVRIEVQTTKTNSRVNHLEDEVRNLNLKDLKHIIDCPAMPKIETIENNLLEYKVFKKYPKLGFAIIVLFVLLSLFSIIKTTQVGERVTTTEEVLKKAINDQEGISKKTRGGWVKYNDDGLSDSIKIK